MVDDQQESAELRRDARHDEPLWPAPVDPVELWAERDGVWPHGVRSRLI